MPLIDTIKRYLLTILMLLLTITSTQAQNQFTLDLAIPQMMVLNAMRSRITVGETVYIGKVQVTGKSRDVITLALDSNTSMSIPLDSVTSWEISMQNGPGSYMREGVSVGMVGALLGGLTGLAICDSESEAPTYGCFLAGAIYFGAPVILLAPLIGASIEKPEEWTMIYRAP